MSYIYLINENQLFEFRSCSLVLDTKFQELLFNNRGIPIRDSRPLLSHCKKDFQALPELICF